MSELTEIQVAMCKVIKECGFEGLDKVKMNELEVQWDAIPLPTGVYSKSNQGRFTVTLDGHTLTQEEYEAWEKQND